MATREAAAPAGAAVVPAETLIARARELAPVLRERAGEAERNRSVPTEIVGELKSRGFFRILQPRAFGGFEHPFRVAYEVEREIGAGCASTAWVTGLALYTHWMLALFPTQAQDDIWGRDPGTIAFGTLPPSRDVRRVAGGYRVSGVWPFSSGCDHADWMLLGIMVPAESGNGPGVPTFALLPRADFGIEDNWFTAGLAATGSKNVTVKDAFVPLHRTLAIADAITGNGPGAASYGPMYRTPLVSIIPLALLTPAIGALQGAIELFVAATLGRKTRGAVVAGGLDVTAFSSVQSRVGEAKAALVAANALADRVLDHVERHEPLSLETRIEARLCHAYATRLTQQGIDALYGAAGASGIFLDQPIQRAWRDIHAIAKHISLNWDAVSAMAGQHAFGLPPQGQY
jgi:alkylation response protein AidB-like acyl-CoA dehydrogenase